MMYDDTPKCWGELDLRWQMYFAKELLLCIGMSKDADTKVGAIIIDVGDKIVLSKGWNDLPRGVIHDGGRNERPLKYIYTSHAERSCLDNALRCGMRVKGKTMLVSMACCPQCACSIVNAGIKEVITPKPDYDHHKYKDLWEHTEAIFSEGGVSWIYSGLFKETE